jgi:predicted dehydrogenase
MQVAMLGVGHWHAGFHADAAKSAGAAIAGVWDEDAAVAREFAARDGGHVVATPEAAMAERPDLAVVLGRGPANAALVSALLDHPVPLLVDKPLGTGEADLAPLAERATRLGRFVTVALANRVGPIAARMASLKASGAIGPISHIQFRIINGPPQRYRDWNVAWMLDRQQSGGGALRNLGLHGLDAFLLLAGIQEVRVEHAAFGRGVHGAPVEDYALVVLRAADGMLGVVEAGYTYADPRGGHFEWRIDARRATLVDNGATFSVATPDAPARTEPGVPMGKRYAAFMADVLARLRDGRPPAVTLDDFRRAMALADRAYAMQA